MSTKHTPGPWFIAGSMTRYVEAKIDGGLIQEVAAIGPTNADNGYGEQQQANADLIAAAPDLLAACQAARALWGDYLPPGNSTAMAAMQLVDEAISRATGGEL